MSDMPYHHTARTVAGFSVYVPTSREDYIYDLRKSFGEPSDSPHIPFYQQLPDEQLKDFAHRSVCLQAREMRSMLTTFVGGIVTCVAAAGDFKAAAAGAIAITVYTGIDLYRTQKHHDKLQQEILDFVQK